MLTDDELRRLLEIHVKSEGSYDAWGRKHGYDTAYIFRVCTGEKAITEEIAGILGYEKAWVKRKKR